MVHNLRQFSVNDSLLTYLIEENETEKKVWFKGDSIMELFEIGRRVPVWDLIPNKWLALVKNPTDEVSHDCYMSGDAVYAVCSSDYVDLDDTPVYSILENWDESNDDHFAASTILTAMNEAYENFPEKVLIAKYN